MALAELLKNHSASFPGRSSPGMLRVWDYVGGTLLTLYFLLSTTLLYHYWELPPTIPNILYRVLALSDFLTKAYKPVFMSTVHLHSHQYTSLLQERNIGSILETIALKMSATMASAAVALLSLTRAMKIQWPFRHIKKR